MTAAKKAPYTPVFKTKGKVVEPPQKPVPAPRGLEEPAVQPVQEFADPVIEPVTETVVQAPQAPPTPVQPVEPPKQPRVLEVSEDMMTAFTQEVEVDPRLTREQTSHAAVDMEQWADDWSPEPYTSAPPPREGMEQRWARCRLGPHDDIKNILKKRQAGWVPRPADTVPPAFLSMVTRFGDQGNVIGNHDSILMERPIFIGERMRAFINKKSDRLHASIAANIQESMPRQHGSKGGSVDEFEMSVTGSPPRRPRLDD